MPHTHLFRLRPRGPRLPRLLSNLPPLSTLVWLASALDDLASSTTKPLGFPDEALSYFKSASGEVILVDNTPYEKLAAHYPVLLKNGAHIATPNKKGFSSDITLWDSIFASARGAGN